MDRVAPMAQQFKLSNGLLLVSTEAPGGVYNSTQLKRIAALCDGETAFVKATEDQRLAMFVAPAKVAQVRAELKAVGLGLRDYQDGLHQPVTCVGELCGEYAQDALGTGIALTRELAAAGATEAPLRTGINGCARCCVATHTLDISVIGETSGYRLCLGGKNSQIPEMATFMAEGIPAAKLPKLVAKVVSVYRSLAQKGETLQEVMERCGSKPFIEALAPYSQDAAGADDPFAGVGDGGAETGLDKDLGLDGGAAASEGPEIGGDLSLDDLESSPDILLEDDEPSAKPGPAPAPKAVTAAADDELELGLDSDLDTLPSDPGAGATELTDELADAGLVEMEELEDLEGVEGAGGTAMDADPEEQEPLALADEDDPMAATSGPVDNPTVSESADPAGDLEGGGDGLELDEFEFEAGDTAVAARPAAVQSAKTLEFDEIELDADLREEIVTDAAGGGSGASAAADEGLQEEEELVAVGGGADDLEMDDVQEAEGDEADAIEAKLEASIADEESIPVVEDDNAGRRLEAVELIEQEPDITTEAVDGFGDLEIDRDVGEIGVEDEDLAEETFGEAAKPAAVPPVTARAAPASAASSAGGALQLAGVDFTTDGQVALQFSTGAVVTLDPKALGTGRDLVIAGKRVRLVSQPNSLRIEVDGLSIVLPSRAA